MCRLGIVLGERRVGINQALDRTLEEHHDHHNAENLKTVAGHVHHNGVHGDLLGRGDGDLPSLLHLERISILGFLGGSLLLLLLALRIFVLIASFHMSKGVVSPACLPGCSRILADPGY